MSSDASETLLQEFKKRSRRFRRRLRRRDPNLDRVVNVEPNPAQPDPDHAGGNQIQLDVDLNEAINLGSDDDDASGDDAPDGGAAAGDEVSDDTWSHDRIDRGREMDRLEQILLKENAEFHLHC